MLSGHIGNLTPQQETALQQFKEAVEDIPNKPDDSDIYYLRWLRAKMSSKTGNFKVHKSVKMFREVCGMQRCIGLLFFASEEL